MLTRRISEKNVEERRGGGKEKVKGEEISTEVRKWEKVTALDGEYNVPGENCS